MTPLPSEIRLYGELAEWWPLLSPPDDYGEEAADLLPRLHLSGASPTPTMLELQARQTPHGG